MFAVRTNMLLVDAPHSRTSLQKLLVHAVTLLELINASAAVNELLTAGIEGVALGADFNTNVLLGGASRKDVATRAADRGLFILGVDTFLHFLHLFLIR